MRIRVTPHSEKLRIQQEEQKAAPLFDALRLSVAARLYELETGKKVTSTTDFDPNLFQGRNRRIPFWRIVSLGSRGRTDRSGVSGMI